MSPKQEVLIVEDLFEISQRGTILAPNFPLPQHPFKSFSTLGEIRRPDSSVVAAEVWFEHTHLRLNDGSSRWAIAAVLKNTPKNDVPKGSRLFIDEAAAKSLF